MKTFAPQKGIFALKKEKSAHQTGTNDLPLGKVALSLGKYAPRLGKDALQMR